jgi:hypothetical protein
MRMGHPARALLLTTALAAVGVLAPPASADVGATIIERCTHGQSISGYPQQAYRRALQELPTEVEEYSDCGNTIRRAQLAAAGASSAPAAAVASATPLTPNEQRGIGALRRAPSHAVVRVGSQAVRPGVVHADISSAFSTLPNALIAVLALIASCLILLGARAIRTYVQHARKA